MGELETNGLLYTSIWDSSKSIIMTSVSSVVSISWVDNSSLFSLVFFFFFSFVDFDFAPFFDFCKWQELAIHYIKSK